MYLKQNKNLIKILAYLRLVGQTVNAKPTKIGLSVVAYQECSVRLQVADPNVQSIKTVHPTEHASDRDVLILAQALVDLTHNVMFKIINQSANALKVMKEILTLDVMQNKVGACCFILHFQNFVNVS